MTKKVLVVEKTEQLCNERAQMLADKGYEVYSATSYKEALAQLANEPDVILLCDCDHECMPWACARILKDVAHVPCVAITRGDERRMVEAFRAGIDECSNDPVKAMLMVSGSVVVPTDRRTNDNGHGNGSKSNGNGHARANGNGNGHSNGSNGNGNGNGNGHGNGHSNGNELLQETTVPLYLDDSTFQVQINGSVMETTVTEFRVLSVLMKQSPGVVTHSDLLRQVWGPEYTDDGSILRLYIHTLRRKISDAGGDRQWIRNVPRVGYSLQMAPEEPSTAAA